MRRRSRRRTWKSLRSHGLSDADIADIVFAASARAFLTKVLDALGVQADAQLGQAFDPEMQQQVTVGRPISRSLTKPLFMRIVGEYVPEKTTGRSPS